MPYLLGTDEAGYGPNLGPLVIAGSLWHVSADGVGSDLYRALHPAIVRQRGVNEGQSIAVADSKQLYSSGKGLRELERGVLALLGTLEKYPTDDLQLWHALNATHAVAHRAQMPWQQTTLALPRDVQRHEVNGLAAAITRQFAASQIRLAGVAAVVLFPEEFNRRVRDCGNKAEVLSLATLQLIEELLPHADEPVRIDCDKHGGRGKYAPLLMRQFGSSLIDVLHESREQSAYRLQGGPAQATLEIRFSMGGEQFLPTALASMTAKYVRELAMLAFNQFWQTHVPNLQPTAGYPLDARRFMADIAATQQRLGIAEELLWRIK